MDVKRANPADQAAREEQWRLWMQSAQDGDKTAYADLLREIAVPLRRMVQRRFAGTQDVEDIVQEILISIHTVRHTYDPARPFGPWLMTIASRRIVDATRRSYARSAHETTVDVMPETFLTDETKSDQDASDDQAEVRRALDGLSPGHRQAVELTKLQGLSLQEASEVSGKSVASLKVSVHRAMKEMRRVLERKG